MTDVRLGLRANARQFGLLVALNALVGAMVGLERSVLPLVGERDFHLDSRAAILSFVVAFGIAKALSNLIAGGLADRVGRKRLLVIGWLLALPVPILIALAPNWGFVVAANLFLGASQGLAWSMTVVMKIDLAGPRRRGLALGLNESAGYLGVAVAAFATGALAASVAPRTVVWVGALIVATVGLVVSALFVHDTASHVALEQREGTCLDEHPGDDQRFAAGVVGEPAGQQLPGAPDGGVDGGDGSDLGDAGTVCGEVERDEPPGERVVEVVNEARLRARAQHRVRERAL